MALEDKQTTLHLVHSQDSKPIDEWRQQYPDQSDVWTHFVN